VADFRFWHQPAVGGRALGDLLIAAELTRRGHSPSTAACDPGRTSRLQLDLSQGAPHAFGRNIFQFRASGSARRLGAGPIPS
jgi:hypothetical protein